MRKYKIALDIDGVLADFSQGVIDRAKKMRMSEHFPANSSEVDCWDMCDKFQEVMKDAWRDEEFWLGLNPIRTSRPVPFTPIAYITSRPVSSSVTAEWLLKNRFPIAPVITVSRPEEKLEHLKELGVKIFVDDLHGTVRQVREAGINAILFEAPYQRGHIEECKNLPMISRLSEVLELCQ